MLVINWRTLTVAPAATTWVGLGHGLGYRCNCSASVVQWWGRSRRPSVLFGSGHGYLQAEPEQGPYSWNYDPRCRMRYTMWDEKMLFLSSYRMRYWLSHAIIIEWFVSSGLTQSRPDCLWNLKAAQNKQHVNHIASSRFPKVLFLRKYYMLNFGSVTEKASWIQQF